MGLNVCTHNQYKKQNTFFPLHGGINGRVEVACAACGADMVLAYSPLLRHIKQVEARHEKGRGKDVCDGVQMKGRVTEEGFPSVNRPFKLMP